MQTDTGRQHRQKQTDAQLGQTRHIHMCMCKPIKLMAYNEPLFDSAVLDVDRPPSLPLFAIISLAISTALSKCRAGPQTVNTRSKPLPLVLAVHSVASLITCLSADVKVPRANFTGPTCATKGPTGRQSLSSSTAMLSQSASCSEEASLPTQVSL